HRLDYTTSHADIGLDVEGNEVLVMQNNRTDYIDLIPIDTLTQPILVAGGSYAGTNRTPIMILYYNSGSPFGLNSGVHISCNYPGFAVVSTTIEPSFPEQNWLDRTLTLVRLDRQNPRVFYLSKLYNTTQEYWEETHAAITDDGSKIVWADNWSQDVGQERIFLMELLMPDDWPNLTYVEESGETEFEKSLLLSVKPNYLCRTCDIIFFLQRSMFVDVEVFNITGALVKELASESFENGERHLVWNFMDENENIVRSGVYFVNLSSGEFSITKKMVLMI
ncbi:T9SS type A sorting domain-containing protein, partial [candidate division WOR-3 bacterium]|nr:T9SS type A sorting domain-containing protein [candidate division WOR-3 bacterium]